MEHLLTCSPCEQYQSAFRCTECIGMMTNTNSATITYVDNQWSIDVLRVTRTGVGCYTICGLLPHLQVIEYGCNFHTILEWLRIASDCLSANRPEHLLTTRNIVGTDGFQESDLHFPEDDVASYRGWKDINVCASDDAVMCNECCGYDVCLNY